ncbi:phosphonate C-P lyase system protein PhnG [Reinekea thalattae]|uniref:Phosphonate C-P lyase system protein PhnG n=1 Tax=Reinekea thalattae TaxID=2593301 RepID=A0A5C8ZB70_9GAMM|nr:phosphonate C-P lyase system protein PhnG [Reinekea thalattae]TXR54529.1 phosphonate C-P lyase system protein PhnG [Reinekea thalattae]
MKSTFTQAERQHWLSTLAKAPAEQLINQWSAINLSPEFSWIRAPETGTVMVQGRSGSSGNPFNLGETTVTRCSLVLVDETIGHGYIQGRNHAAAEIVALCDALLQQNNPLVLEQIIQPLETAAQQQAEQIKRKAAATKVDFFTLARGED